MIKAIIAIGVLILASGCATTKPPTTKYVVVSPPQALLACPQAPKPPLSETLTNQQIAEYIDKLYINLKACGLNMKKIEQYITQAKKTYEDAAVR